MAVAVPGGRRRVGVVAGGGQIPSTGTAPGGYTHNSVNPRRLGAALLLSAALLTACGTDGETSTDGESEAQAGGDAAGRAACDRFRRLAGDAFAETISARQVEEGLREVGDLAADSTDSAIRESGIRVGEEASAATMISGEPDPAQDALAGACNAAYPL